MTKQFVSDSPRFIGGSLRKANVPFTLQDKDVPKKLPKGLKVVGELTPAQKAAQTKAKKKAEEEAAKIEAEKAAAGVGGGRPDFMDATEGKIVTS